MADSLRGQVAIVTGASAGIGEHVALTLAARGAKLVLAARRGDELARVAALCRAAGGEAIAVPTDVSVPAECAALVAKAAAAHERIDWLVNNAGLGFWGRIDEVEDLSVFERMLRVNYLSAVWCTVAALPHLKRSQGRVVAVCSLAGKTGVPLRGPYAAAKHAMAGFFDTLRIELRGSGVSVTMIHPGFVATGSQARNLGADGKPIGTMPVAIKGALTPQACAEMLIDAAVARRREVVPSLKGKFALLLKAFAPGRVDDIAARAIQRGR